MIKTKVRGLRELERALAELPKATGKNVLRRVAKGALEPMRAEAEAKAPKASGDLQVSIVISTQRTRRAKGPRRVRKTAGGFRSDPATSVTMAMGPSAGKGVLNYATFREFGTIFQGAHPFMRPAFDAGATRALDYVTSELKLEIDKAAKRLAKKQRKS